jgi:hypothetical protein
MCKDCEDPWNFISEAHFRRPDIIIGAPARKRIVEGDLAADYFPL